MAQIEFRGRSVPMATFDLQNFDTTTQGSCNRLIVQLTMHELFSQHNRAHNFATVRGVCKAWSKLATHTYTLRANEEYMWPVDVAIELAKISNPRLHKFDPRWLASAVSHESRLLPGLIRSMLLNFVCKVDSWNILVGIAAAYNRVDTVKALIETGASLLIATTTAIANGSIDVVQQIQRTQVPCHECYAAIADCHASDCLSTHTSFMIRTVDTARVKECVKIANVQKNSPLKRKPIVRRRLTQGNEPIRSLCERMGANGYFYNFWINEKPERLLDMHRFAGQHVDVYRGAPPTDVRFATTLAQPPNPVNCFVMRWPSNAKEHRTMYMMYVLEHSHGSVAEHHGVAWTKYLLSFDDAFDCPHPINVHHSNQRQTCVLTEALLANKLIPEIAGRCHDLQKCTMYAATYAVIKGDLEMLHRIVSDSNLHYDPVEVAKRATEFHGGAELTAFNIMVRARTYDREHVDMRIATITVDSVEILTEIMKEATYETVVETFSRAYTLGSIQCLTGLLPRIKLADLQSTIENTPARYINTVRAVARKLQPVNGYTPMDFAMIRAIRGNVYNLVCALANKCDVNTHSHYALREVLDTGNYLCLKPLVRHYKGTPEAFTRIFYDMLSSPHDMTASDINKLICDHMDPNATINTPNGPDWLLAAAARRKDPRAFRALCAQENVDVNVGNGAAVRAAIDNRDTNMVSVLVAARRDIANPIAQEIADMMRVAGKYNHATVVETGADRIAKRARIV